MDHALVKGLARLEGNSQRGLDMKHLSKDLRTNHRHDRSEKRKFSGFLALCLVIGLIFALPSHLTAGALQESAANDWDAEWEGTLDAGTVKLRLLLQLKKDEEGEWEGQLISLDQNNAKMMLKEFSIDDESMSFELAQPPASFEGALSEDGTVAEGKWNQGGFQADLVFERSDSGSEPELIQVWNGTLKDGNRELRMRFRVLQDDEGEMSVRLDSLDEGISNLFGELTHEGDSVVVEFSAVGARFEGTMNDAANEIDGEWKQRGASLELDLERAETLEIDEPNVVEIWTGTMDAGIRKLRMQFRVVEDDESRSVLMDSLTEGINGVPGEYSFDDGEVTFKFGGGNATYSGTLNDGENEIEGNWEQSGVKIPLTLERKEESESDEEYRPNRPQTPEPPFPYEAVEVKVPNTDADVVLSGTLTLPEGDGPFPAAILVSGSGPQDRDETLLEHKPFLVIADALSRRGIAVLRYDDRGVGGSTGEFGEATTKDFANDASACVDFLMEHESIDANAIGIIGHSEGGLVGPLVAASRDDLGYVVMLAGPGVTGEEIIYAQTRRIAGASGESESNLDAQEKMLRSVIEIIKSDLSAEEEEAKINEAIEVALQELDFEDPDVDDVEAAKATAKEQMKAQFGQFQTPWFRFFLVHDPAPVLKQVECPVLSLIGEKDLQVPYDQNIPVITKALEAAPTTDVEIVMLPELNHLFQHSDTGSPLEYQDIEETFDPATLELMADWIRERFVN